MRGVAIAKQVRMLRKAGASMIVPAHEGAPWFCPEQGGVCPKTRLKCCCWLGLDPRFLTLVTACVFMLGVMFFRSSFRTPTLRKPQELKLVG